MDVDPKLQTNRVSDLGRTVRPSTRYAVAAVAAALAVLAVFALICSILVFCSSVASSQFLCSNSSYR